MEESTGSASAFGGDYSRLRALLANIERRPGMFLNPYNPHTLLAFLQGFDASIHDIIRTDFLEWIRAKHGTGAFSWTRAIMFVHQLRRPDDDALTSIYQLLYAWLDERADEANVESAPIPTGFIWVFTATGGVVPAGLFSAKHTADAWIARHGLTGMLTRMPVGIGYYDWAVAEGRFTPQRPDQASAAFVQTFSCASAEHVHYEQGVARTG